MEQLGDVRLVSPLFAFSLMLVEYLQGRLRDEARYDLKETGASLAVSLGNKVAGALSAGLVMVPALWLHERRLFEIPLDSPWAWGLLFLGVELAYYVQHAALHHVRWFWATHSVHHSPTKLNLSAGVRLGWTGQLSGAFAFFLPLCWLGFPPAAVFGMFALNLGYQFFLHLSRAPHLGPLEWVLNTPRHHQVHHASNEACIDKNFGGVLIIFDRLFGTFAEAPAAEPLRYGLTGKALPSQNPFRIAFHGWILLVQDLRKARGARERLSVLLGRP